MSRLMFLVVSLLAAFGSWAWAQDLPPTGRRLCDPLDGAQGCPGDTCRCTSDTLSIVFPGSGGPVLEVGSPAVGKRFDVEVVLDATAAAVDYWSFGVLHDPGRLRLESVTVEGTDARELVAGGVAVVVRDQVEECVDFPRCNERRPEAGFICAVIIAELVAPQAPPLRTGTICRATYTVIADVPGDTSIAFTDHLRRAGSPTADITLSVGGRALVPQWVADGIVRSVVTFHRGDVTNDGLVTLTDPIELLTFLFKKGPRPGCLESLDVDDSGRINVTDAVSLLYWLFAGGPPPPPPGPPPGACGPDPATSPGNLGCGASGGC